MTDKRPRRLSRGWFALWPWLVLWPLRGTADALPARVQAEVSHLATCAAYYFSATQAAPMRQYEALYAAGERARNRALRYLDPAAFDRLMGDAAIPMTALTGGDWRQFHRVDARYADGCREFLAAPTLTPPGENP